MKIDKDEHRRWHKEINTGLFKVLDHALKINDRLTHVEAKLDQLAARIDATCNGGCG